MKSSWTFFNPRSLPLFSSPPLSLSLSGTWECFEMWTVTALLSSLQSVILCEFIRLSQFTQFFLSSLDSFFSIKKMRLKNDLYLCVVIVCVCGCACAFICSTSCGINHRIFVCFWTVVSLSVCSSGCLYCCQLGQLTSQFNIFFLRWGGISSPHNSSLTCTYTCGLGAEADTKPFFHIFTVQITIYQSSVFKVSYQTLNN